MKKALFVLIAVVAICHAGLRKVVTKIIVADTVVTIKVDTIKTVKYDTLLVRQLVKDSSWVVKADTVKASEAPKSPVKATNKPVKVIPKKAPKKAAKNAKK